MAHGVKASQSKDTGLAHNLVDVWPSLPFLAYGVWLAWAACMYSGSFWISDTDMDSSNLSELYVISTLSFAAVFVACAFLKKRGLENICSNKITFLGGIIAALGALLVIAVGPYYLGAYITLDPLFWLGSALTGVGSALMAMRLAAMYGVLAPRYSLLCTATSQVVVALIFFTILGTPYYAPVAGGPSWTGILGFILLPLGAAFIIALPRSNKLPIVNSETYSVNKRELPKSFWKLVVLSFILPAIAGISRGTLINGLEPGFTLESNSILVLIRLLIAAVFVAISLSPHAKQLNFGKLFSIIALAMMVLMTCIPLFDPKNDVLSILIFAAYIVFDLVLWCLLALVVLQKRISPLIVFGFGRGAFMLGSALGWAFGAYVLPYAITGNALIVFWVLCAGIALASSVLLFSERDSEKLFSPISEDELTLESLMDADWGESEVKTAEKQGRFSKALDVLAQEYKLTPREQDVLRCLSMGRGSEFIAEKLSISWGTARTHTHNVYVKMNVHSREELIDLLDDAMKAQ